MTTWKVYWSDGLVQIRSDESLQCKTAAMVKNYLNHDLFVPMSFSDPRNFMPYVVSVRKYNGKRTSGIIEEARR